MSQVSHVRQLREQRGRAVESAQNLIPGAGEQWKPERRILFNQYMEEAENLKRSIDKVEAEAYAGAAEYETRSTRRPAEAQIGGAGEYAGESDHDKRLYRVFSNFLRHGVAPDQYGSRGLSAEDLSIWNAERRDMTTGGGNALQGTGGGYFVPVGFVQDVEIALKYYGNMLNIARIMDTATGQPLPYPLADDTQITGEICAEGSQVTSNDIGLSNAILEAYKFSSKMIKISLELAQDSAFDLNSFITDQFGVRLGRILNKMFTTGNGTTEPEGVITGATASGVTMVGDDNATSPSPITEVGYLDLVGLEHSVDPLYRRGAKWMMHDSTLKFLKGLKDKYGHPLWTPGFQYNAPDTILGYPYSINNDMDELGAGKICVAFGDFSKFIIRRVKELAVLRLVERYADYGQVAYIGFGRWDSKVLDAGTHPIKYLVNHS